jgi:thiosulfate dehydrogenase [quinone] large subunit
MSDTTEKKPDGSCASQCCNCDYALAFWALRLWLGVRALLAGVEKFGKYTATPMPVIDPTTGQPDASGVIHNVNVKHYAFANYSGVPGALKDKFTHEPLLPPFALNLFDHVLGPLFILTGVMLLVGLGTRISLFVQALLYVALTVGLILIDKPDGIAYLGIHVGLVAFALALAKYNKFALLKKW